MVISIKFFTNKVLMRHVLLMRGTSKKSVVNKNGEWPPYIVARWRIKWQTFCKTNKRIFFYYINIPWETFFFLVVSSLFFTIYFLYWFNFNFICFCNTLRYLRQPWLVFICPKKFSSYYSKEQHDDPFYMLFNGLKSLPKEQPTKMLKGPD